jgi:hypothetical protein
VSYDFSSRCPLSLSQHCVDCVLTRRATDACRRLLPNVCKGLQVNACARLQTRLWLIWFDRHYMCLCASGPDAVQMPTVHAQTDYALRVTAKKLGSLASCPRHAQQC